MPGLDIRTLSFLAMHEANSADDAGELMKKAYIATYAAKPAGRNGYRLFEEVNA
ncbi:MAG: hypothetical protein M0P95_00725 [Sulfuritalea sp.]|jgi:GGDEF domain-containing protein|nr:hypothetical protein [Sulfuritalea sp.]